MATVAKAYRAFIDHYSRLCERQISATGLAVFRILFGLTLLHEVVELVRYRRLIFEPIPYLYPLEISWELPLYAWCFLAVSLTVGFATRYVVIANYVLTVVVFGATQAFEYHWDYPMTAVCFLLLFAPVSRRLSVDAWLARRYPHGPLSTHPQPHTVAAIWHYAILVVCVGLVYFDSVFHKAGGDLWLRGLGLWLPASLPPSVWVDLGPLLDQHRLMTLAGYSVFFFEALFVFLVWIRRVWLPLLLLGATLHLGILLLFPIPGFALGTVAILLLMVPVGFWDRSLRLLGIAPTDVQPTSPEPKRQVALRRRWLGVLLIGLTVVQLGHLALWSPIGSRAFGKLGAQEARVAALDHFWRPVTAVTRAFFGAVPHGVFVDAHFRELDAHFRLVYERPDGSREVLPFSREDGLAHHRWLGRLWAFWSPRVQSPPRTKESFSSGVQRLTAYWLGDTGRGFDGTHRFRVEYKSLHVPFHWEPGLMERNRAEAWRPAGRVRWEGRRFIPELDPRLFESDAPDAL